jgi:hypothetical protein
MECCNSSSNIFLAFLFDGYMHMQVVLAALINTFASSKAAVCLITSQATFHTTKRINTKKK